MENEVVYARKKITLDKFVSEVKLTPEFGVKKVLGVFASGLVSGCEQNNGGVNVSGKLKACAIVLTEEDRLERIEAVSDFSEKQQLPFALESLYGTVSVKLTNFTQNGNEIVCFLDNFVTICGNYKYEVPSFSDLDGDFVLSKKTVNASKLVASAEDNFVVAEEVESNLTDVSVLSCSASVAVEEVEALVDKVVIQGKVILSAVCSDQNSVLPVTKEFEFKQEVAATGALPNMKVDADVLVKNANVTPEQNDEKTTLVCVFDLFAKCFVGDESSFEAVADMFSLKNELQTSYSFIEMGRFEKSKSFTDTALLVSDVSKLEDFDDIVSVVSPEFSCYSVEKTGESYVVSGKLSYLVLYKSTEGYASFGEEKDVKVELQESENVTLRDFSASPVISSFKVKAGKDLEVMVSLNCQASFESKISERYVVGYELKAEKLSGSAGIKVYVTGAGETLFEAARNLNVRPELISSQNDVGEVLEQGEKIYIYSPVNLF